jgi:hypothetical protein
MTDALAQTEPAGAGRPPLAICRSRWAWPWLVLLVVLFHAIGTHPLRAHDIIDTDQANDLVAAASAAAARVKTAAGSGAEGEARFALGMAVAEATAVLNRDLAAHNGRLTVNAELVLKSLAQRDMALAFDEAIGRYRLPRASQPTQFASRLTRPTRCKRGSSWSRPASTRASSSIRLSSWASNSTILSIRSVKPPRWRRRSPAVTTPRRRHSSTPLIWREPRTLRPRPRLRRLMRIRRARH